MGEKLSYRSKSSFNEHNCPHTRGVRIIVLNHHCLSPQMPQQLPARLLMHACLRVDAAPIDLFQNHMQTAQGQDCIQTAVH